MDVIIGAGATGLSYAAFTNNPYLIIEKDNEVGGYCKTIKKGEFIWDYSGHFFHFRDDDMKEFILKHIKSDDLITCRKQTQISYKGNYIDFPFQKNIHQLDKDEFIDCLYDLFTKTSQDTRSFKKMLYSKFGRSIADKFLIPYNEKLYACDLDCLDCDAMGRFFPHADKEDIIRNFRCANNSSYNDTFIYPKGGAIEYIHSLLRSVNDDAISLGEEVLSIDIHKHIVYTSKREVKYDHLISTMPLPWLLKLCQMPYDKTHYSWNKVLVFNLGFDLPSSKPHNHWVYFPGKELSFYRVGFYDRIFNDRKMSLYVELGFSSSAVVNVEVEKQKVLTDLQKVGIIKDHTLLESTHILMNPAYVHLNTSCMKDVQKKKEQLAVLGIYSIGRYGSWTYCSIEDGMQEALEVAKITNKFL